MIGMLIGLIAPTFGEKAARPIAWLIIIAAAVALFFGLKACYDQSIVTKHDAKIEASAAKADRAADQKAAEQKEHDLARQNEEADQLIKVQANAKTEADRRLAFHRCLRLQQRARENGLVTPRCV